MSAGIAAWLAIMIVSEAATLAGLEPFASWNTPICWTGFILFADSVVWRARGDSWLRSSPREFAFLAFASIPLWLVFEFYNLFLNNWRYVNLPPFAPLRYFGYAWAFATIWPAIFEGAELVAVWRGAGAAGHSPAAADAGPERARAAVDPQAGTASMLAGALMLVSPLVVSSEVARYLAAPVWLGFIFLLDPVNRRLGAQTLRRGRRLDRVVNLAWSGFLCGFLWEFWNYWARTKWIYTVPIMEHLKIFEMPVPGYFGFPAFALECFTMYVFVRRMWRGHDLGRAVAL